MKDMLIRPRRTLCPLQNFSLCYCCLMAKKKCVFNYRSSVSAQTLPNIGLYAYPSSIGRPLPSVVTKNKTSVGFVQILSVMFLFIARFWENSL